MAAVDPSGTASYTVGLFGIPTSAEKAKVVVIPVPWEVTTSYGGGTANGPLAVWKASAQIDLFDRELGKTYEYGYHLVPIPTELQQINNQMRPKALQVRAFLEKNEEPDKAVQALIDEVNKSCAYMTEWVYAQANKALENGQIPAVLGGDHSVPEGNIRAVSESLKGNFAVLHLDAHADLREAYQGFTRSHASIMHNVMSAPWKPQKLVQLGIRDFSEEEFELTKRQDIKTFFDSDVKAAQFGGQTWQQLCDAVIKELPQNVYLSFDVDGLSPEYCPSTGTPVPGGYTFDQVIFLVGQLVRSGRKVVGFDLNEVAPAANPENEWDAIVGARLLYKLCGWSVKSQTSPKS